MVWSKYLQSQHDLLSSASGGGNRSTKRKRTTGFDCDDSEVKVVRVRTAEDRIKEAHDNNEVADLS